MDSRIGTRNPHPAAHVFAGTDAEGGGPPSAGGADAAAGATAAEEAPGAPASPEAPAFEGEGYEVRLDAFEGPLDLLLYLIKRDEVDVTDIPIARITDQYLESINEMERLDLDLDRAGEYLLMAATLMRIKSRMLVPRDEDDEDDEDGIDPRQELVRRLLEYREFKRIAEELRGREDEWRQIFSRAAGQLPEIENEDFEDLGVSLVDLFRAFNDVLRKAPIDAPLGMETEEYSVEEQVALIVEECGRNRDGVSFTSLFTRVGSRSYLITTFLALLEMIRLRQVRAEQVDQFGEIWIRFREQEQEAESNEQ